MSRKMRNKTLTFDCFKPLAMNAIVFPPFLSSDFQGKRPFKQSVVGGKLEETGDGCERCLIIFSNEAR